jgi:hypothetical protein
VHPELYFEKSAYHAPQNEKTKTFEIHNKMIDRNFFLLVVFVPKGQLNSAQRQRLGKYKVNTCFRTESAA